MILIMVSLKFHKFINYALRNGLNEYMKIINYWFYF